jgi:hypothetical protein
LLVNGVSATKEVKQLLDGIVSSMMEGERDDGKGMKNVLNSGVSASGKTDEKLLTIGVSATGKMKSCCQSVFQQQGESCCEWCCSRGRGEKAKQVLDGVVSGVKMMGEWDVSVTGKK